LYASTGGDEAPGDHVMFTFDLERDDGNVRSQS
jgi:hypothetical protein